MIKFTYENEAGEEIDVTFPAKMEVCSECDGHGTHLREGMKGHAYSMEEFQESFDPEEQEEYFRRGGRYDVTCETCHGSNVVPVIDEERCKRDPELEKALKAYYNKLRDDAEYESMCAAERRMGA